MPTLGDVVVSVVASGSKASFTYQQACGSDTVVFALQDGQSHTTSDVAVGTDCTVTQTKGPPGTTNVAVKGSAGQAAVETGPPQGQGLVSSDGTLTFVFTAPPGSVVITHPSPSPTPTAPAIALPNVAATAIRPVALHVRKPIVASLPPTPGSTPNAVASTPATNRVVSTLPAGSPGAADLAGLSAIGAAVVGAGAAIGLRVLRRRYR